MTYNWFVRRDAHPWNDRISLKAAVAECGESPLLVGFLGNDDPAAKKYAEWTARTCAQTGISFELRQVPRLSLEDGIIAANSDPAVHGIMVYYPIFGGAQDQYLQNTVSVEKDVEGLSHTYRYNMYHGTLIPKNLKSASFPALHSPSSRYFLYS